MAATPAISHAVNNSESTRRTHLYACAFWKRQSIDISVLRFALVLPLLFALACASSGPIGKPERFVQPTVAVESFENLAPFPLRWQLGEGMSEQLVASLVESERVGVVTRVSLGAVLDEIELQKDPRFRNQGRVEDGRLKNGRYLIRGKVIDFTHTSGGGLHFVRGLTRGRAKGYVALVTIALSVIDVETREVETSTFEGRAWAGELSLQTVYGGVAFGGKVFHKTPLGEATGTAIRRAVRWVVGRIADRPWQPLIARIDGETLYLSGGVDRGLEIGDQFEVREPGDAIVDPATGDVIGHTDPRLVGRLRIVEVRDRFAIAAVVDGDSFAIGQACTAIETND